MGTILTIAESFDNGSFDISSDIRTIEAFGFECVPFAVNDCTRLEVASAMNEIFASGQNLPAAVKVGFITSAEVVNGVAERLKRYKVSNIVVDPAIISEDGQIIVTEDVFVSLSNKLFPLAAVLTPNPYEVELLAGMEVHSEEDLVKAGCALSNRYRCAVFVKAFNSFGVDLLCGGDEYCWFQRGEAETAEQYSFSAAFACQLPHCESLEQAAITASEFVFGVVGDEQDSKASIPFSTTPKEELEATKPVKLPEQQPQPQFEVKTMRNMAAERQAGSMQPSAPSAPSRPGANKDIGVVVDIDNFTPEPVIDESLSKSLNELRAKLDKLR